MRPPAISILGVYTDIDVCSRGAAGTQASPRVSAIEPWLEFCASGTKERGLDEWSA